MATKANSFRDRNVRLDPAMKAGIAATVCSVLIVALALLAMHTLPVGFCRFCSSKRRDKFRATPTLTWH
jgi:hypothetical protein